MPSLKRVIPAVLATRRISGDAQSDETRPAGGAKDLVDARYRKPVHKFGRLRKVIDLQRDHICAPRPTRQKKVHRAGGAFVHRLR